MTDTAAVNHGERRQEPPAGHRPHERPPDPVRPDIVTRPLADWTLRNLNRHP